MHDYDEIKVNTQAKIKGPRPSVTTSEGVPVTEGARWYLLEIMADGRVQVGSESMERMCIPLNVAFVQHEFPLVTLERQLIIRVAVIDLRLNFDALPAEMS
jgi:hypothetical protein